MRTGALDQVTAAIGEELPAMARAVIKRHLDLSDPCNRVFYERPDDREQHQTEWHQWGIITHTRHFLRLYDREIPAYLRQWGVWEAVDFRLMEKIDGVGRGDLLRVSILLHDIGKFAARRRGPRRYHFASHERLSGEIIRRELHLARFGLSPAQVEYVARTSEDHFVLGLLRKRAREQGTYDVAFTEGEAFRETSLEIKRDHPDDFVEIGVLFLGDSLAKADPETGPERAVSQYTVNVAAAHRYLSVVLQEAS